MWPEEYLFRPHSVGGHVEGVRLTELVYATAVKGSLLKLYMYYMEGAVRVAFTSGPIDPGDKDTHTAKDAMVMEMLARSRKIETKVTNFGDELVFHSKDGVILYPKNITGGEFWKSV